MKTKLEIFCAYLPYDVPFVEINDDGDMRYKGIDCRLSMYHIQRDGMEEMYIALRPLSLLQTPMVHPVTGEEIENPIEWILSKAGIGSKYYVDFVQQILTNPNTRLQSSYFDVAELRQIDSLALSLHFDIYGAIEQGFAIEYGAAQ